MMEGGRIVVLVGQIASGKTTLARYLQELGFERVVPYTTRLPCKGERSGVEYHLIPEAEFLEKEQAGFFAEHTGDTTEFGHVYYGTSRESLETPGGINKVLVLNPADATALKEAGYDIFLVCLDFDQVVLMRRALERGDSPVEIGRRIASEARLFDFLSASDFVDLRVTDPSLSTRRLAEMICEAL